MNKNSARETLREFLKNSDNAKVKDAILELHPALAESKDEKIRKKMVEHFRGKTKKTWCNIPVEDIISYLEKQKELPFVKDVMLGYPAIYFYDGERMHFQGNPAMEEKQKEQDSLALVKNVVSYLEDCKYAPAVKGDISKIFYRIDIPRHEDDFWKSQEYKKCVEILGDYYSHGIYSINTYKLYVKRTKEEQKEHKPILEVFGFKVGDAVRLKNGDGRKHIIKSFEEVKGLHGPNFYRVEFEDNSARDGIYPGEEYPNGYYTQMEKFEEEQKPEESITDKEINQAMDDIHNFKVAVTDLAKTFNIRIDHDRDIDWYNFCASLLTYLKRHAEWSEEDADILNCCISSIEEAKENRYAYKETDGDTSYDREIAWLKSLLSCPKPSKPLDDWKPTKEQLDALLEAAREKEIDREDGNVLYQLYDQLKKL